MEITDYYELIALYRVLYATRFSRQLIVPELPGSPLLAEIAKRTAETLVQMDIDREKPERAKGWTPEIQPIGEVWKIAIRNAAIHREYWQSRSHEEKISLAKINAVYRLDLTTTQGMLPNELGYFLDLESGD